MADLLTFLNGRINRAASPEMFRVLDELDLSFSQMKALFVLEGQETASVKDLAGHLSLSLPAMSRSVDGLVARGYVARTEDAADRRAKRLALLPPGRAALDRLVAARQAALVAFAGELTEEERTALHTALLPIAERIRRS